MNSRSSVGRMSVDPTRIPPGPVKHGSSMLVVLFMNSSAPCLSACLTLIEAHLKVAGNVLDSNKLLLSARSVDERVRLLVGQDAGVLRRPAGAVDEGREVGRDLLRKRGVVLLGRGVVLVPVVAAAVDALKVGLGRDSAGVDLMSARCGLKKLTLDPFSVGRSFQSTHSAPRASSMSLTPVETFPRLQVSLNTTSKVTHPVRPITTGPWLVSGALAHDSPTSWSAALYSLRSVKE